MLLYFFPFVVNHKVGEARNGIPAARSQITEGDNGAVLGVGQDTAAEAQQAHDPVHPSPPVPIPTSREEAEAEDGVHFTIP